MSDGQSENAQAIEGSKGTPWAKQELNPNLASVGKHATLITVLASFPIAAFGFFLASFFGLSGIGLVAGLALAVCWITYRSRLKSWYRYASWVFEREQTIDCAIELISAGELDKPYIRVIRDNRMTRLYETRVFKIVHGDLKALFSAEGMPPGSSIEYDCFAYYDRSGSGDAFVFDINGSLIWCRASRGRGI
ncbi:MAG: hypothetical protein K2X93_05040 [Candidatus Obscuribacterales bacterium]|nr:hypothetical protein [Candidatus Obscuribacterales bacterium]